MRSGDWTPAVEGRGLLAGEPFDRRTALRLAAGAVLGIPAAIPACGTIGRDPTNTTNYVIEAFGTKPPISDLARLIKARARTLGMSPGLFATGGGPRLAADLRRRTSLSTGIFDPRTNTYPPVNKLIVVGVSHPAALEPIAATAIGRGIRIISYPLPMQHQTAAITVDAGQGAAMLAGHAATWARARLGGRGGVLLVLPSAGASANPYVAAASSIERTLSTTLAREAPGLTVTTTTDPVGGLRAVAGALASRPGVRMVLVWDDDSAIGAAEALRRHHTRTPPDGLYVGALGAPAVTSRATFTELQRDDVLRVVIAARARDLANAMVDLPHAVLTNARPRNIQLALQTLTPRSSALARYSRDYAPHPPTSYPDGLLYQPPQ